ncbi:Nn.00g079730.m01.CDS01 [Neocucurbitaria sp. VM-36]
MAADVPPGSPPDASVGGVLLVLTGILMTFTALTTVLRLWARWGRGAIGWDDHAIVICCILAAARTGLQIDSVKHGNGRHRWHLSQEDYEHVNFLTWMTQIFLFTNIGLLKCSICLLILRIKKEKVLRRCLCAMMIGLVLTNVEPIIVLLAQCKPIKKSWRPGMSGRCWPTQVRIYSIYVQVAYSVVTDLICALLPVVVLWKVKISLKTKIGVCCLMSLGLVATAVAIVRASSLGLKTADLSYDYCIAAIWANTELHLGIIATNLALSRMIWTYFWKTQKSLSSNGTPRYGTGSNLSKSRHGYMKSKDRGPYAKQGLDTRGSFDNFSQGSQIPLESIIKKTTSVHISSDPVQRPEPSKASNETLSEWPL